MQIPLPVMKEIKLPHMRCDVDCGGCCGFVLTTKTEHDRVRAHIEEKKIVPVKQGYRCPFYQEGTCAIYEVRPFACRLFGHSPRMVCERMYNVNIPLKREEKLWAEYGKTGACDETLHTFAYDDHDAASYLRQYLQREKARQNERP